MSEAGESRPARLNVGVVGTGRVGAVLGAALNRSGHRVVAGYGVSDASRERAEALLPGVSLVEIDEVFARSDLVLMTVPDDVLPGLVDGLVSTDTVRAGQFVVHTSGRMGIGVFDPATRAGALPLALHPAMTFTGTSVDVQRLEGATFGVTAPEPLWPVAEALVIEMGSDPVRVPEEYRGLYHVALTHGANHLVTVVNDAMDLLRAAGVEQPDQVLAPLLSAALDNTLRQGDDALTGPVSRGDSGTVADHLREIRRVTPELEPVYTALARRTATRALASGRLQASDAESLLEILATRTR
ncbi:DUF2520 domain-containing protein [Actinobacteria bacterium YIM 96077]|uniref:Oxidoreductase n=1 Tax=Phytoactinopolyspora halophila TaxID=1981511 RepID=A0A329R3H6_9ACTN|nr:DUF2520 domain-containing protein [Phytoactinopolyspora halophila]AYY11475.1 DUF2520 domain-containing protein [Actinobacteria bacterium YIM 96077]RAW18042.1 oxidoreductase [Phytoactinopolyspora halophila]